MKISEDKILTIDGQRYIKYDTLLAIANKAGLKSLDIQVVQAPAEDNRHVCICRAEVTFRNGKRYCGIGDASPISIKQWTQIPRMVSIAAMRSVISALTTALPLGDILVYEDTLSAKCQPVNKLIIDEDEPRASMPQLRLLHILASKLQMDPQTIESLSGLGRKEAAKLIDEWKRRLEEAV